MKTHYFLLTFVKKKDIIINRITIKTVLIKCHDYTFHFKMLIVIQLLKPRLTNRVNKKFVRSTILENFKKITREHLDFLVDVLIRYPLHHVILQKYVKLKNDPKSLHE